MFQFASPHAPATYAGMGFNPHSPGRMGAMVPFHDIVGAGGYRAYDIVGADVSTWQKVKDWGDKPTMGVKNKWLVTGAVVVGLAWYGYYAGWFGR